MLQMLSRNSIAACLRLNVAREVVVPTLNETEASKIPNEVSFATSLAGYLPPPDYDNQTPMCSCDEDRISELADRINKLEQKAHYREKRQEGMEPGQTQGAVAFTAYLSSNRVNLSKGQAVVYDQTLLNEGGHYDVGTGQFTAPVNGIYLFSFIIETKHMTDTAVQLVVDGMNMLDAVVEPRHTEQNLQGGNVGAMKLTAGQKVWVSVYNTDSQFLEGLDMYRFTTFTGVMLHATETEGFVG